MEELEIRKRAIACPKFLSSVYRVSGRRNSGEFIKIFWYWRWNNLKKTKIWLVSKVILEIKYSSVGGISPTVLIAFQQQMWGRSMIIYIGGWSSRIPPGTSTVWILSISHRDRHRHFFFFPFFIFNLSQCCNRLVRAWKPKSFYNGFNILHLFMRRTSTWKPCSTGVSVSLSSAFHSGVSFFLLQNFPYLKQYIVQIKCILPIPHWFLLILFL